MIPFAGSPGDFFNRIGRLGKLLSQMRTDQNAQLTNITSTTVGVVAQFDAESDIQGIAGQGYVSALNTQGVGSLAQQIAEATVNRMVFRDNPRINQTLDSPNTLASMQEIIRQMKVAGQTVLAAQVAYSLNQFQGGTIDSNVGNGILNCSVNSPSTGLPYENAYAEAVQVLCSEDSYIGGASQGNEGFTVTGVGADTNPFAFNWPLGSNGQTQLNAIDGNSDNAAGNLLTNSGFEEWTNNVPDNWSLVMGTEGVSIVENQGIVYDGNASLQMVGDGSTLTQIRQQFDSTSGTSGELTPLTQYSICIFARRDGIAASQGTLTIDLTDANGVVIQDQNGVDNTFSIDLTALTVFFAPFTGVFRTPLVMPNQIYLRVRQSVALENGRSVYLDKLSLGEMTQLYSSGPYFAVHSGSTPFNQGDFAIATITNTLRVANALDSFQCLMFRLLPEIMQNNELQLPSSASPTISDTLITS